MKKKNKPPRHRDTEKRKVLASFYFLYKLFLCLGVSVVIIFFSHTIQAQSTDQNFPTAVTTNQVNGAIRARDIGDSRLTTYYYVFGGGQGDIFINVVTKNFDGDIDVFTLNGLRPLTKIRVYSDSSDNETGRIVYLRQPEKLILRVEGRSPNDEPATFQIKFAGSFVAEKAPTKEEETKAPQVKTETEGEVTVNSVGTIIPKPSPKPSETPAKTVTEEEEKAENIQPTEKEEKAEIEEEKAEEKETVVKKEEKSIEDEEEKPKVEVVITDNLENSKEEKAEENKEKKAEVKTEEEKAEETPKEVNPLENIKLTIVFKDGRKIERPMSEILSVNVDKAILTVIEKDGTIGRYSLLDIVEFTIK